MRRFYVDGPFGQVHCRTWGSNQSAPPILCLAPAPFSSKAYLTLAPLLAAQRKVIALDYPGYGESDVTSNEPSIEDFAQAALAVVESNSIAQSVDLLGFHSGCLVAAEMSVLSPKNVNHLLLIDVPFFSPEKQAELLRGTPALLPIGADLVSLEKTWKFCVSNKLEHIPLPRAYQMFTDHISSGPLGNKAFRAAFTYSCEKRFKRVQTPTTVFATQSTLAEPTRATANIIEQANLVDLSSITAAVLEAGAEKIVDAVFEVLK